MDKTTASYVPSTTSSMPMATAPPPSTTSSMPMATAPPPSTASSMPMATAPPPSYEQATGTASAGQIHLNPINEVDPSLPKSEIDDLAKKEEEKIKQIPQATAPPIITEQPVPLVAPTQVVYVCPPPTRQRQPQSDCFVCIWCDGTEAADCCFCLHCCADHTHHHTHIDGGGGGNDGCCDCGGDDCCNCCGDGDCDCNCCGDGDCDCDCGDCDCDCGDCDCDCGDCVIL